VKKQVAKVKRRKMGSVLDRIAPVELSESGMKMNVYGRSGTGKTTFACTFPKPLLLVGTEDGTRSVYTVKGVDYVRLENSGELVEITEMATDGKYNTVVLDTASGLQDMILKEVLNLSELPAQGSWGMASRSDWGQCTLQTRERLRALLDLTCNIVIIAQERAFNTSGDESGSSEQLMPNVASALSPSVTGWLNPACDYIGQMLLRQKTKEHKVTVGVGRQKKTVTKFLPVKGAEYCLRVGPSPVFTTKFRMPRGEELPEMIVDPSYEKVDQLVRRGG
jgi:hypothetical protein